jgi:flagellar biosynthesis/type III secretory pathway protein FliH
MSSSLNDFDFGQLTPAAPPEPAQSFTEAAQQARSVVAAAEAEADRIRAQAHAEGFAAGREDARQELAPAAQAFGEAMAAVRSLEAEMADRLEPQAVELALQVAERVVSGALALQPERLLDIVRGALRTIVERERVTVFVHPEDLVLMREALPDLEVHEERRVGRGGAILRTQLGEVDARVETKLERAREAMLEELSQ